MKAKMNDLQAKNLHQGSCTGKRDREWESLGNNIEEWPHRGSRIPWPKRDEQSEPGKPDGKGIFGHIRALLQVLVGHCVRKWKVHLNILSAFIEAFGKTFISNHIKVSLTSTQPILSENNCQ